MVAPTATPDGRVCGVVADNATKLIISIDINVAEIFDQVGALFDDIFAFLLADIVDGARQDDDSGSSLCE